jgi:hypothetical protein
MSRLLENSAKPVAKLPFRPVEQKQSTLEYAAPRMRFGARKLDDTDALI